MLIANIFIFSVDQARISLPVSLWQFHQKQSNKSPAANDIVEVIGSYFPLKRAERISAIRGGAAAAAGGAAYVLLCGIARVRGEVPCRIHERPARLGGGEPKRVVDAPAARLAVPREPWRGRAARPRRRRSSHGERRRLERSFRPAPEPARQRRPPSTGRRRTAHTACSDPDRRR